MMRRIQYFLVLNERNDLVCEHVYVIYVVTHPK